MSFWILGQVFLNLILLAAVGFIWVRLSRPAKDDPRLSRGLQLLQSKISVLEDLSDRTEIQVTQLTSLMEQKCRDIQTSIVQADKQVLKIEASMGKSLEVAKIFQDKIPHQEIIERQNTLKYIKAARLAHQGHSIEEITAQVDLSHGEIDFIAKVNRDGLQFSEEDLPPWAQEDPEGQALSQLGDQFRQASGQFSMPTVPASVPQTMIETETAQKPLMAVTQHSVNNGSYKIHNGNNSNSSNSAKNNSNNTNANNSNANATSASNNHNTNTKANNNNANVTSANNDHNTNASNNNRLRDSTAGVVKKVVFPRIDGSHNLG